MTDRNMKIFRWSAGRAVLPKDLGAKAVVTRMVHHPRHPHFPTWPTSWLHRPSYSDSLFRGSRCSTSSRVDVRATSLSPLGTMTFWVLSHLCSPRQRIHWTRTLGFAPSSPSFRYWLWLVLRRTRLVLQLNSCVVLHA